MLTRVRAMSRPDPVRSRPVLIGTSRFASPDLPDHPVIRNNVTDLADALTEPRDGVLLEANCTVLIDETDIGRLRRALKAAAGCSTWYGTEHRTGHRNSISTSSTSGCSA